jgi:hypothetical protein
MRQTGRTMTAPFGSRLLSLIFSFLLALSAHANWVVFELHFDVDEDLSMNFSPYSGAYVIAPIDGGAASFVFTTEAEGRAYAPALNSAKYFLAVGPKGRRAGISAAVQNGTSQAMYQASGQLTTTVGYDLRGERQVAFVPQTLIGHMLSADDESTAQGLAADGSMGVFGSAVITGDLRGDLTQNLNAKPHTMLDAVEHLTSLLERYGYVLDGTQLPPAPAAPAPVPAPQQPPSAALFPPGGRERMEEEEAR